VSGHYFCGRVMRHQLNQAGPILERLTWVPLPRRKRLARITMMKWTLMSIPITSGDQTTSCMGLPHALLTGVPRSITAAAAHRSCQIRP
jgi:hypothetical protein